MQAAFIQRIQRGEDYARGCPCFSICIPLLAHLVVLVKAVDFSTLVSTIPRYRKFGTSMNTTLRVSSSAVKPKSDYCAQFSVLISCAHSTRSARLVSSSAFTRMGAAAAPCARARPIAGREPLRYARMDEARADRASECASGTLTGGHCAFLHVSLDWRGVWAKTC